MAGNLTGQVRNIAEVTTAVANGDLSKKITVDVRGEILQLKNTINTMVDQLRSFASEVTRVAREVGTEGKLGGQADVRGVAGTWKDLTDSVNSMAGNLTGQVRNIAEVTTAVANGDLSKKITVDVKGEILELKNTINTMVDQLSSFAAEVTRVAREVGSEGKLGGQADVSGVAGTWKDLTDSVNSMAGNLTGQVRNIAEVTTAVANGDLVQEDHRRCAGRNSGAESHHQHDGGSAPLVRLGSDARGARSRFGRRARRPGASRRRLRHVERSDRLGELHGVEPDDAGAKHRRRHDRGRQRRSFEEDHGRRQRRDPRAEEHRQHDGGSAELVRLGSDPRGPRSRHGRKARRPGGREGCRRHVEGSDRLGELHGRQPDRSGAGHRESRDRGRERRPETEAARGSERRNRRARRHDQLHDRHARHFRRSDHHRGARGRCGRKTRRPGERARAPPARGAT